MTRLRKLFVGGCNQVAESVRLNIQRAVEELSFRITELRSLAHWRERYAVLGLDVRFIADASLFAASEPVLMLPVRRSSRLIRPSS